MTRKPGNTLAALAAMALAASVAAAYAAVPPADGEAAVAQEKMPPKDCKKNPDDPRCKEKPKY